MLDLGIFPLGVELDESACETREAAGHRTLRADVSALDPLDLAPVDLLIASPPCPTFSDAGSRHGRLVVDVVVRCATALAEGRDERAEARAEAFELLLPEARRSEIERANRRKSVPDLARAEARARRDADLSLLVVEPLRFALALRSAFVALEQVPPVLPLWEVFARILRDEGYAVWTGILNAADHGVPQTRRRALLLASLAGPVSPPAPTHCRGGAIGLFGDLKPWVSMAEALGWGMTERPSVSVLGSNKRWGAKPLGGGSGAQRTINHERDEGRWLPAPTITTGGTGSGGGVEVFAGREARERVRRIRTNNFSAVARDPDGKRSKAGSVPYEREVDEPAPAFTFKSGGQWVFERSATPTQDAVRVTVEEAAILQGFRPDYPWRGSRTAQFQQIGNAVPPPLARSIVAALVGAEAVEGREAAWRRRPSTVFGEASASPARRRDRGSSRLVGTPSERASSQSA